MATRDSVAMAFRAGATVADPEFVQFHPTALKVAGQPRFLLSEALRGEGARLLNEAGDRFRSATIRPAIAPRDRVARSIELESRRTGSLPSISRSRCSTRTLYTNAFLLFLLQPPAARRASTWRAIEFRLVLPRIT